MASLEMYPASLIDLPLEIIHLVVSLSAASFTKCRECVVDSASIASAQMYLVARVCRGLFTVCGEVRGRSLKYSAYIRMGSRSIVDWLKDECPHVPSRPYVDEFACGAAYWLRESTHSRANKRRQENAAGRYAVEGPMAICPKSLPFILSASVRHSTLLFCGVYRYATGYVRRDGKPGVRYRLRGLLRGVMETALECGNLEVAQMIFRRTGASIFTDVDIFRAVAAGNLQMVKWIHSVSGRKKYINIHAVLDASVRHDRAPIAEWAIHSGARVRMCHFAAAQSSAYMIEILRAGDPCLYHIYVKLSSVY